MQRKALKVAVSVLFSLPLYVALLALPVAAAPAARQDTTPKEDIKDAGKSTKNAAQKTGSATKKETKKVVHKSAQKTKEGADKVEDKTAPNK